MLLEFFSEKRKVAFLARTVPLVTQQYKIFVKYLPDFKVSQEYK